MREVLLVDDEGQKLGVQPIERALEMARERGLDLVEVAPNANPPVCRILDYGKFKYEQQKKEREAHKHQRQVVLREVRIRPVTGQHDIDFKTRLIEKLLGNGDKVKVTVMFRGRQIVHPEIGRGLLQRVAENLKEVATVERGAAMEGRFLHMILNPIAPKPPPAEKKQRPPRDNNSASDSAPASADGAMAAALEKAGVPAETAQE